MAKKVFKWLGVIAGAIVGALIVTAVVDALLLFGMFSMMEESGDTVRKDGSWQRQISQELLINVQGAEVLSESDSHGGFLGDGTAMVALQLPEGNLPEGMKDNPNWKPLPMSAALAEEVYNERGWFTDEKGTPFVPAAENGYYLLIDRHDMATDIFDADGLNAPARYSQNYTLAVYDADENILYYLAVDT